MSDIQRIRPPRWLRLWNKVFIQMSRLGVTFGREGPAVLTVAGRKSGKPRSTPVTPMIVDGERYVVGGFPGADWAENVRVAREVTLLLRAWPTEVPTSIGFMKRAGLVREGSPEEFEALAGWCAVFRLEPLGAQQL